MKSSLPLAPVFSLMYFIAAPNGLDLQIQWLADEL